jgi:molybdopterin-binding protein
MPLLLGEGLVRRYGGRTVVAVDRVAVEPGEVLAILGPNGAGKSTLFRLLALLERPDAGRVVLADRPVRSGDTQAIRRLATVFQRPYLFAGSVARNVGWGLSQRRVPPDDRRARVAEALTSAGLAELAGADVTTLSGGERQRVALARAIATRPEILLLDEPTAGLDVTIRAAFRRDLERMVRGAAAAAILITHDPSDAFGLADRIAIMEGGSIVQEDVPEDLVLSPATPFAAALTGAELLLDGTVESDDAGLVTVRVGGAAVVAVPAAGGLSVGGRAHVAYRPEDVVIASPGPGGATSAINRFDSRIVALVPAGPLVRLRLEGDISISALVTRRSAEALGLAPGTTVVAQVKATALRAFAAS